MWSAAGTVTSVRMSRWELKAPNASSWPITSITCRQADGIAIFALSVMMHVFSPISRRRGRSTWSSVKSAQSTRFLRMTDEKIERQVRMRQGAWTERVSLLCCVALMDRPALSEGSAMTPDSRKRSNHSGMSHRVECAKPDKAAQRFGSDVGQAVPRNDRDHGRLNRICYVASECGRTQCRTTDASDNEGGQVRRTLRTRRSTQSDAASPSLKAGRTRARLRPPTTGSLPAPLRPSASRCRRRASQESVTLPNSFVSAQPNSSYSPG